MLTTLDRGNMTKAEARALDPTVARCEWCNWWKKLHADRVAAAAARHARLCKGAA